MSKILTLDGHADTAQRLLDNADSWHLTSALGSGHLNLASARSGGLSGQIFAIWVDPSEYPEKPSLRAFSMLQSVHAEVQRAPAELALCVTADQVEQAHHTGHFAVLLSLEGGHAIENDLTLLRRFHAAGIRSMTLTWSHSVGWADSCGDILDPTVPHANGLGPFGRQVVAEMNRLGMLVDVSHVSDQTLTAVLDCSQAPVIASHSSARALTAAPRNLTDDQIRAIAATGGLVMVNYFPAFIHEPWRTAWNDLAAERHQAQQAAAAPFRANRQPVPFRISDAVDRTFCARIPRPPFAALVDHFDHILRVAGPDHVGLGSDFDGIPALPQGLDSIADLQRIPEALTRRGHSAETLTKLLGANLLRVMRAAEAHSTR